MSLTKQRTFQVWGERGEGELPGTESNIEVGMGRVGGMDWLQLAPHSFPPSAPPTLLPGAVPGSHSPSVKVASRRSREQVCVNTQMPLCPVGHHYPIELSAAMVIFYILLSNMIATSSVWLLST